MKLEYSIVLLAVGLLYAILKNFLPDFPVDDAVFQAVALWLLAKLGVELVGAPAAAIRKLFTK
jgi:hypothetical protein